MGLLDKLKNLRGGPQTKKLEDHSASGFEGADQFELANVGPYRIVAPIGKGGMGTVNKAIDPVRDQTDRKSTRLNSSH